MDQKVEYISVEDLVLWSENPRDAIDANASDQEIVDKALLDKRGRWELKKLAKQMGDYYDLSELPTVVYQNGKPIVYDGNRRIILAKIRNGLVSIKEPFTVPDCPEKMPCNVCLEDVALNNVLRKHGGSGTWSPLDRDIFLNKFMKQPKSPFLKLEENTGLITSNPDLNQVFVKNEIFNLQKLQEMGFDFDGETLVSKHTNEEAESIFQDVITQVVSKRVSTRGENRGKILSLLDKANRDIIEKNKDKQPKKASISFTAENKAPNPRRTPRTKPKDLEIFGQILVLESGDVSNLYRDIYDLYNYYNRNKTTLSTTFPALIRMSLRLLCETASIKGHDKSIQKYIKTLFGDAKKQLTQDEKTTLSTLNVTESSLIQLLQAGAHNYSSSNNLQQTLGISLILGAMLNISHGKK